MGLGMAPHVWLLVRGWGETFFSKEDVFLSDDTLTVEEDVSLLTPLDSLLDGRPLVLNAKRATIFANDRNVQGQILDMKNISNF